MELSEKQNAQSVNAQENQELFHDKLPFFNWTKILLIILGIAIITGTGVGGYLLEIKKNEIIDLNKKLKVPPTNIQAYKLQNLAIRSVFDRYSFYYYTTNIL